MRVLSLFSGAGGMDLGLQRAGHEIIGHCEIDPTARKVLARHWPGVPCHPDVTTLDGRDWYGRVDVVAGGSPCTDLSMAGRRAGRAEADARYRAAVGRTRWRGDRFASRVLAGPPEGWQS